MDKAKSKNIEKYFRDAFFAGAVGTLLVYGSAVGYLANATKNLFCDSHVATANKELVTNGRASARAYAEEHSQEIKSAYDKLRHEQDIVSEYTAETFPWMIGAIIFPVVGLVGYKSLKERRK
jgi:hypothetical protein